MRLTELAHQLLDTQLASGDLAIDATAGNGYDTAKLARLVGSNGRVIAIDLQAQAIASTRERLRASQLETTCELVQADHAQALQNLLPTHVASVSAITFNLGYLPGSDKAVQTLSQTTLPALDASAELLKPGGLLLVTAYRGHAGGETEALAVADWMRQQTDWQIESHEPEVNGPRIPPILWVGKKAGVGKWKREGGSGKVEIGKLKRTKLTTALTPKDPRSPLKTFPFPPSPFTFPISSFRLLDLG